MGTDQHDHTHNTDEHAPSPDAQGTESLTVVLRRKRHVLAYTAGDTVLEAGRRGGLNPPFSCESGTCATCMAMLTDGTVVLRENHILSDDELEEGWILTCQALPTSRTLTVDYK